MTSMTGMRGTKMSMSIDRKVGRIWRGGLDGTERIALWTWFYPEAAQRGERSGCTCIDDP